MHQLAESTKQQYVWYQLDSHDNDLALLVKHLLIGFGSIFPGFGRKTAQLITRPELIQNYHLVVSTIINELAAQTQAALLVLDDFHLITGPLAQLFFQELLHYLPPNIRLIISSRNSIPISLSRLCASGLVIPITMEDLCFDNEEIKEFFNLKQTPFNDEIVTQII